MRNCIDCGSGPCYMNCGPWATPNETPILQINDLMITGDKNMCYKVYKIGEDKPLQVFGNLDLAKKYALE